MSERTFDYFDQRVADMMIRSNESVTGLPRYLGVKLIEFAPGKLVAKMDVRAELLNPFGTLHGGVIAGVVDHVLGCVMYPLMQRGQWAATTEFKLNYLAPVRQGTLTAESTVLSLTKRTAVVRIEVTNDGRPACLAQGTVLIADPPAKKEGVRG